MDELNSQLSQMRNALQVASEDDKPVILKIIQDLEELIQHSSSTSTVSSGTGTTEDLSCPAGGSGQDDEDEDEFMKFQREIADLERATKTEGESGESNQETKGTDQNIESELEALQGMKCKAPFEASWGQIGYYNAVVTGVENDNESEKDSIDLIKVRVLFSQPISKGMLPCPFYFESTCRYSDEICKFSHGAVVSLSLLKEYQEPDHNKVVPGSNVLAKFTDGIWYKAKILKINDDGECDILYDKYKENSTVPMHDTCPIDDDFYTKALSESDSNSITSDEYEDNDEDDNDNDEAIEYSNIFLLKVNSTSVLGDWEKHTTGFGSKIMAKMGYIIGTGLGKNAEGRIEPVDAYVLPPGISLDTCMELKEKAGDTNLFSAAKKLKKAKKKEIEKTKRDEEKLKKDHSVFEFLNKSLGMSKSNKNQKKNQNIVKQSSELNKDTSQILNKKLYNIGEEMKETRKKIESVKASIKRHERDPKTAEQMKQKLQYLENHLIELKKSEVNVSSAVKSRNDLKKVTIF